MMSPNKEERKARYAHLRAGDDKGYLEALGTSSVDELIEQSEKEMAWELKNEHYRGELDSCVKYHNSVLEHLHAYRKILASKLTHADADRKL